MQLNRTFKKLIYPWWLKFSYFLRSMVLYMSSSFWLLLVESCDFFQAEKEKNCLQSWANSQSNNHFHSKRQPFLVKIFVILRICSALQAVLSFSAWGKITWLNSQQPKTRVHVEHQTQLSSNGKGLAWLYSKPYSSLFMQLLHSWHLKFVQNSKILSLFWILKKLECKFAQIWSKLGQL